MLNIEKQVNYWSQGAIRDIDTARLLIISGKYVEGLFFCHLCIEKILKALVVKRTNDLAPKTHNLNYLSELAKVNLDDDSMAFISVLMKYQLEGRYPDHYPNTPTAQQANVYLSKTNNLLKCLEQML